MSSENKHQTTIYPVEPANSALHCYKLFSGFVMFLILVLAAGLFMSALVQEPPAENGKAIGASKIEVIDDVAINSILRGSAVKTAQAYSTHQLPHMNQRITANNIPQGNLDLNLKPQSVSTSTTEKAINETRDVLNSAKTAQPATQQTVAATHGEEDLLQKLNRLAADATSIVYIVDRSGSMGSRNKINRALVVMKNAVDNLPKHVDSFQIILFNDSLECLDSRTGRFRQLGGSLQLIKSSRTRDQTISNSVSARGGTRPLPAVAAASAALRGQKKPAIALISDGEFSSGDVSRIKAANKFGAKITCIVVGSNPRGAGNLQTIAKQNGG